MRRILMAQAVLDLGSEAIAKARGEVQVHRLACAAFGPDVAAWAVADNRDPTEASKGINDWVKSGGKTGVMAGRAGHGKTSASARWSGLHGAHMIRAVSVAQWPWGGGEPMRQAMRADVLFVDDLGRENPTQQGATLLVDVICGRHDAGRKTLATSMIGRATAAGRGKDQTPGRYPDHMMDRIGANWIGQREDTKSFRGNGIAPVLAGLERAREVAVLAHHVSHVAGRVGLVAPDQCVDDLAELLGLSDAAVRERVELNERELADMESMVSAFCGPGGET